MYIHAQFLFRFFLCFALVSDWHLRLLSTPGEGWNGEEKERKNQQKAEEEERNAFTIPDDHLGEGPSEDVTRARRRPLFIEASNPSPITSRLCACSVFFFSSVTPMRVKVINL